MPESEGPRIHIAVEPFPCGHCDNTIERGEHYVTNLCSHTLCAGCTGETFTGQTLNEAYVIQEREDAEALAVDPTEEENVVHVVCPICGERVPDDDISRLAIMHEGENVYACMSCYDDHESCAWCGCRWADGEGEFWNVINNDQEELWCTGCMEDESYLCDDCNDGTRVSGGDIYHVNSADRHVCRDCFNEHYFTCESCDEAMSSDYSRYIEEPGIDVCDACFENSDRYCQCEECGENRVTDRSVFDPDEDYWYCPECAPPHLNDRPVGRERRTSRASQLGIKNYSFKPTPNFYVLDAEARRLNNGLFVCGVETEIEVPEIMNRREPVNYLNETDSFNLFYCKSDSSIRHGFEIVSHPFSYDWMRANPEAFVPMFNLRKTHKATSYNTANCGMHVHIARRAFRTKMHLLKFSSLFFNHHDFIFRISRRNPARFENYSDDRVGWPPIKKMIIKHNALGGDRYVVNYSNTATVEVRLFRGTLSPRGWYANIEFLKALYDFTSEVGVLDVNPKKFSEWSEARADIYPNYIGVLGRLLPTQEGWSGLCA